VKVSVRLDDSDLRKGIKSLRSKFPYAVKRALARTTTTTVAAMAKAMREDTYLSTRFLKSEIKVSITPEAAQLVVMGQRMPLMAFGARGPEPTKGRGRGVSYRNPGGGRNRAPEAFIGTMSSGHRGVFKRVGAMGRGKRGKEMQGPSFSRGKSPGAWSPNLPIIELHGPSMVRVFEKFMAQGAEVAQQALLKNLKHEISYALSKE
jgi:hypothetical protein